VSNGHFSPVTCRANSNDIWSFQHSRHSRPYLNEFLELCNFLRQKVDICHHDDLSEILALFAKLGNVGTCFGGNICCRFSWFCPLMVIFKLQKLFFGHYFLFSWFLMSYTLVNCPETSLERPNYFLYTAISAKKVRFWPFLSVFCPLDHQDDLKI